MIRSTQVDWLTHRVVGDMFSVGQKHLFYWGTLLGEVWMIYEKPEVRDFGAIADHTYGYNDGGGEVGSVTQVTILPDPGGSVDAF
jgi:hypothetical protein